MQKIKSNSISDWSMRNLLLSMGNMAQGDLKKTNFKDIKLSAIPGFHKKILLDYGLILNDSVRI